MQSLSRRFVLAAAGAAAAVSVAAPAAHGASTSLVSAPDVGFPAGVPASTHTSEVDLSGDGRFVVFRTPATGLVAGVVGGTTDHVYVRDTETGATALVTVALGGGPANGPSYHPRISEDGRYVAFRSDATDLIADDANAVGDVFVRDLVAGTTTRASVSDSGGELGAASVSPAMSANGRKVAFTSFDPAAAPGSGGRQDVYLRDLDAGTTTRLSVTADGSATDDVSTSTSLNGDGRYAVFQSRATNLVPGNGRRVLGIYLRDVVAGTTTRISITSSGAQIAGPATAPAISADGRRVAFQTVGPDVVAGDDDRYVDVFVRDLGSGQIIRASRSEAGSSNGASTTASISADGNSVVFYSGASTLVEGDANGRSDVFVRELDTGRIERVSVTPDGGEATLDSVTPIGGGAHLLSGDGRHVAFLSYSRELVPGDASLAQQAYVRDRYTEPGPGPDPEPQPQTPTPAEPQPTPTPSGGGTPPATSPAPVAAIAATSATKRLRSGSAWIRLRGADRAFRGLRAQRVTIAAGGAARRAGGLLTLPVQRGSLTSTVVTAQLDGVLSLQAGRGARRRTLRLQRPQLRADGKVARITAVVGGLRRSVFTLDRAAITLDRERGRAAAKQTTLRLTPAGARVIRRGLRLARPLAAGEIGRFALDALDTVAARPATPAHPAAPQTPAAPVQPAPTQPAPPTEQQPQPEPPTVDPIVSIGTTDWGFRASFRNYVFNGNGRPPIAVADGATCATDPPSTKGGCPADVPFAFTAVSGEYDAATGTGVVENRGTVVFHYPGHFFRLELRDPRLTITPAGVVVNARIKLDSTLAGTPSVDARVDLGSFPLAGVPTVDGRRLTLRTTDGALSAAAAGVLGSFLQEGAELDALTVAADVVGAD